MPDCNQSNISNHFSSTLATSRQVFGQHGQLINEPRQGFFVFTFSYIRLFSRFMDVTLWFLIAQDCKGKCFWPILGAWSPYSPIPPSRLTESVPKAELQVNTRQQRLRQKTQKTFNSWLQECRWCSVLIGCCQWYPAGYLPLKTTNQLVPTKKFGICVYRAYTFSMGKYGNASGGIFLLCHDHQNVNSLKTSQSPPF